MRKRIYTGVAFALAGLACTAPLAGCHDTPTPVVGPLPPKTVLLATMMSDLSVQPGFDEGLIEALGKTSKTGAAILSPKLIDTLRNLIVGKHWRGLDRFPGWTMKEIDPAVGAADRVVGEKGAAQPLTAYLDLGTLGLDHAQAVDLDQPSALPGFSDAGLVAPLGNRVVRGDGANPQLAPLHSESARLAEVMTRLSLNRLEGAAPVTATLGGNEARTPEEMVQALLATGHQVTVSDARYFANFGHLHYEGMDVMMPFFVGTQVRVPGTNRELKVPVSHAEYEWEVRGPKINANVAFYFGIDGKAEFRTMDTLDQFWVMGRHAHEYREAQAVEVTRLTGLLTLAYAHEHQAHPRLPFGGYYALGVCQDGVAAIEKKMTGQATLFPNTTDETLFNDPRDPEINALIAQIPKDREGKPPQMERVFGSLPTTDLAAVTIPGLASDLESVHTAWLDGTLGRRQTPAWLGRLLGFGGLVVAVLVVGWLARRRRDRLD